MSTSDTIQIISIIASLLTSTVAIIISVISVRQNAASIKAMSSPCITIYFEMVQIGSPLSYFVIRNIGHNAGQIIDLSYNDPVKNTVSMGQRMDSLMKNTINMRLAPDQRHLICFNLDDFDGDIATFDIVYGDSIHRYREHIVIPLNGYRDYTRFRSAAKDSQKIIANALQEIIEQNL